MEKEKKKNMCKYWHEDDFGYGLREVCKANSKIVTCSGVKKQCDYPYCYEEMEK